MGWFSKNDYDVLAERVAKLENRIKELELGIRIGDLTSTDYQRCMMSINWQDPRPTISYAKAIQNIMAQVGLKATWVKAKEGFAIIEQKGTS